MIEYQILNYKICFLIKFEAKYLRMTSTFIESKAVKYLFDQSFFDDVKIREWV